MSDVVEVELLPFERQSVERFAAAIAESERDIKKAKDTINYILSVAWNRAGGDLTVPFRVDFERNALVASPKEQPDGMAR